MSSKFSPLSAPARALLNAFGAQHEDHSETSSLEAEIAAIEATHPDLGMSYGPRKLHVNTNNAWAAHKGIFVFQFGAYGCTHVLAFGSLEDALEDAAETLKEVAPGHFTEIDWEGALAELISEGVWPEGTAIADISEREIHKLDERATQDTTYTESGYLISHEWYVHELRSLAEVVPYVLKGEV